MVATGPTWIRLAELNLYFGLKMLIVKALGKLPQQIWRARHDVGTYRASSISSLW